MPAWVLKGAKEEPACWARRLTTWGPDLLERDGHVADFGLGRVVPSIEPAAVELHVRPDRFGQGVTLGLADGQGLLAVDLVDEARG